jgi:putative oxidoreductase
MRFLARLADRAGPLLMMGADVLDLCIRLHVARVFLLSGLTKLHDWDTTLALFRDEYHVPLLPPAIAAPLGTFGEVVFPLFLALGLGTRFAAFGLTLVNVMAVVAYWHVLSSAQAALAQHVFWGTLLLVLVFHGPGRLSVDQLIAQRLGLRPLAAVRT